MTRQESHAAHVVATPMSRWLRKVAAIHAHRYFFAGIATTNFGAHGFDNFKPATLGNLNPGIVKQPIERLHGIGNFDGRHALHHAHRRKHTPCKTLIVRVAMIDVVVQWQEQLHRDKHHDESTTPGGEQGTNVTECSGQVHAGLGYIRDMIVGPAPGLIIEHKFPIDRDDVEFRLAGDGFCGMQDL